MGRDRPVLCNGSISFTKYSLSSWMYVTWFRHLILSMFSTISSRPSIFRDFLKPKHSEQNRDFCWLLWSMTHNIFSNLHGDLHTSSFVLLGPHSHVTSRLITLNSTLHKSGQSQAATPLQDCQSVVLYLQMLCSARHWTYIIY